MNRFFIKDSKNKKSLTATILFWGSVICFLKLLFSGLTFGNFSISIFSGSDFALIMSSLGGIYTLRRSVITKEEEEERNNK